GSGAGGTFLGFGISCQNSPCERGACCIGQSCSAQTRFECIAESGQFLSGVDCNSNPCAFDTGCPENSLFSQPRDPPDRFTAFTSEQSSNLLRYENFDGVAGAIEELVWWGVDLHPIPPNNWSECAESDPTFVIS